MNDHLKKLEDQCWTQIPCDFDMMADGLSTVRTVFDREKFAHLIIKECIKVATKATHAEEKYEAWYLIQEHFEIRK